MFEGYELSVGIGKTGQSVVVKWDDLPELSKRHVLDYGIRQILNDARASAKTDDEAVSMVEKRLENLLSGTLRASAIRERKNERPAQ